MGVVWFGFCFVLPPIAAAGKFLVFAGFEKRGAVCIAEGEDASEGGLCVGLLLCGFHSGEVSV